MLDIRHFLVCVALLAVGCPGERPDENLTLGETPAGTGPMVIFDVLEKPLDVRRLLAALQALAVTAALAGFSFSVLMLLL